VLGSALSSGYRDAVTEKLAAMPFGHGRRIGAGRRSGSVVARRGTRILRSGYVVGRGDRSGHRRPGRSDRPRLAAGACIRGVGKEQVRAGVGASGDRGGGDGKPEKTARNWEAIGGRRPPPFPSGPARPSASPSRSTSTRRFLLPRFQQFLRAYGQLRLSAA
jgi:hypothetical protein